METRDIAALINFEGNYSELLWIVIVVRIFCFMVFRMYCSVVVLYLKYSRVFEQFLSSDSHIFRPDSQKSTVFVVDFCESGRKM